LIVEVTELGTGRPKLCPPDQRARTARHF